MLGLRKLFLLEPVALVFAITITLVFGCPAYSETGQPPVSKDQITTHSQQATNPKVSNFDEFEKSKLETKSAKDYPFSTQEVPPNDDFNNASVISSFPYLSSLDTSMATVASDDPLLSCGGTINSNTVWYKYTATISGLLTISTLGSNYDTVLALFTGSRGSLHVVSCNDDYSGTTSQISFPVGLGNTYYVEAANYGNPSGGLLNFTSQFIPVAANDDFNQALTVSSYPFNHIEDTSASTTSIDDPIITCGSSQHSKSVWYKIISPTDGRIRVQTTGSNYDTVLAVFSGNRGSFSQIVCDDDSGGNTTSDLKFNVSAEQVYYVEVVGYGLNSSGGTLNIHINLQTSSIINVPLDIVLLQDETGSMSDDISSLRNLTPQIWDSIGSVARGGFRMSVIGFRDYARSSWGDYGDWVYRKFSDFTNSRDVFVSALNLLTANGGNDTPEAQLPALMYLTTPSALCIDSNGNGTCSDSNDTPVGQQPSFRNGVKRVILLATDAPFHSTSNTTGYPGPTLASVISALNASNTAVIGLVPGGAGAVPDVDTLAQSTGGSVQSTGSSGQDIADAIATAIGVVHVVPPAQRVLALSAQSLYYETQNIRPSATLYNSADYDRTFDLTVRLFHSSEIIAQTTRSATVPSGRSVDIPNIDFGQYPSGKYSISADLRENGGSLAIENQSIDLLVANEAAARIILSYSSKLADSANAELNEISTVGAHAYAQTIKDVGLAAFEEFLLPKISDLIFPIQQSGNLPSTTSTNVMEQVRNSIGQVRAHKQNLVLAAHAFADNAHVSLPDDFDPFDLPKLSESADDSILGIKDQLENLITDLITGIVKDALLENDFHSLHVNVNTDQLHFDQFVQSTTILQEPISLRKVSQEGVDRITGVKTNEAIFTFYPPSLFTPPEPIRATIGDLSNTYDFLNVNRDKIDTLALIGAILVALFVLIILILGIIGSGGALAALLASAVPVIANIIEILSTVSAVVLLIMALVADSLLAASTLIAPKVPEYHQNTLTAMQNILGGLGEADIERFDLADSNGSLQAHMHVVGKSQHSGEKVMTEIVFYSIDGQILEIKRDFLNAGAGLSSYIDKEIALPHVSGLYRAVATLYSKDGIHSTLSKEQYVESSSVSFSVRLTSSQTYPSEAIGIVVDITNTSNSETAQNLTLALSSNDPSKFTDSVLFSLGPRGTTQINRTIVPTATGNYMIHAWLGYGLYKLGDSVTPFVVGNGPAIAVNLAIPAVYTYTAPLVVPVEMVNSGNTWGPISVTLKTIDKISQITVYSSTLVSSLNPDARSTLSATVLPDPIPGQYAVEYIVNGRFATKQDFVVSARDTLYTSLQIQRLFLDVGQSSVITASVRNTTNSPASAGLTLTVQSPTGEQNAILLRSFELGQYSGVFTSAITGTYELKLSGYQSGYRVVNDQGFIVSGQPSTLIQVVDGQPKAGVSNLIKVSARNEYGVPIAGVNVAISNVHESWEGRTDSSGLSIFAFQPTSAENLLVKLEKTGYNSTHSGIALTSQHLFLPFLSR